MRGGYPSPNRFRSIEIWETASKSDEYLESGWLARARPAPPQTLPPTAWWWAPTKWDRFSGAGARVIALANTEQFLRNARLTTECQLRNAALKHLLSVERGDHPRGGKAQYELRFQDRVSQKRLRQPNSNGRAIGRQQRRAWLRSRVTLGGFDTPQDS